MLNDESGVPNKKVQEILAGRAALPLATREADAQAIRAECYCGSVSDCRSGAEVK